MGCHGGGYAEITRDQVARAEWYLETGWPALRVAAELEISRSTVLRIQAGRHVHQPLWEHERYKRCAGCGGVVAGECVLCAARASGGL
jgi:hypothetical protein